MESMRTATRLSAATLAMLFIALAALAQTNRARPASSPTVQTPWVGILREDAVLVPIGVFDGTTWNTPWPGGDAGFSDTSPRTLAQVPAAWWGDGGPRKLWELLGATGGRRPIRARDVIGYRNHCTGGVGLATDYARHVSIEPNSYPLPYAGIATTRSGMLQPVSELRDGEDDFGAVTRAIPALYARLEPPLWREIPPRYQPNLNGALPNPRIDHVFAANLLDGRRIIQFTAHRELLKRVDGGDLEAVTRLVGWFVRPAAASRLTLLDARASQTDLDGKGGDDELTPMAALSLKGRSFWIGRTSGYESENYVIVEVSTRVPSIVATLDAGGC